MSDTKQVNKCKGKKSGAEDNEQEAKKGDSFFYPKHNLYSKREYELLDSIYSDEPGDMTEVKKQEAEEARDFWPQANDELLERPTPRKAYFSKVGWFTSGVVLSSLVWLVFFQVNVNSIQTKSDTEIVYQNKAKIITDKTVDKELTKKLEKLEKKIEKQKEVIAKAETAKKGSKLAFITNLFGKKEAPAKEVIAEEEPEIEVDIADADVETIEERVELAIAEDKPAEVKVKEPTLHTIRSGDSLWIIARDYYGNPSPENIRKIMEANDMSRVGVLRPGKKIVIPL